MNDLNFLELQKEQFPSLDYLITENKKVLIAAKKLQNNKSAFSDKIKNEMIKASLQEMMPAYLKLFNSILTSGIMPNTWCRGLITPIYMPEFLKTGLAKIRTYSTTWQLKTTRFVQRSIKKPISDAGQ